MRLVYTEPDFDYALGAELSVEAKLIANFVIPVPPARDSNSASWKRRLNLLS